MWGSDAKVEAADATGEAMIIKAGFLLSAVESDSLEALSSSGVIVFFCTTLVQSDPVQNGIDNPSSKGARHSRHANKHRKKARFRASVLCF